MLREFRPSSPDISKWNYSTELPEPRLPMLHRGDNIPRALDIARRATSLHLRVLWQLWICSVQFLKKRASETVACSYRCILFHHLS